MRSLGQLEKSSTQSFSLLGAITGDVGGAQTIQIVSGRAANVEREKFTRQIKQCIEFEVKSCSFAAQREDRHAFLLFTEHLFKVLTQAYTD